MGMILAVVQLDQITELTLGMGPEVVGPDGLVEAEVQEVVLRQEVVLVAPLNRVRGNILLVH
jgi:hypothetical protein